MKKLLIFIVLIMVFLSTSAQWYQKTYGVDRIDLLTDTQMDEAEGNAKEIAAKGGIMVGVGAISCLAGYLYISNGLGEDPTFIEELLGPRLIGRGLIILGIGTAATGAVIGMVGLIRKSSIQAARNRYYPEGKLNITPVLIPDYSSGSLNPGVSIVVRF